MTKKDELALNSKTKLPFPNLGSFTAIAITLSFVGFADETGRLLKQISSLSRKYSYSHRDILKGFLV